MRDSNGTVSSLGVYQLFDHIGSAESTTCLRVGVDANNESHSGGETTFGVRSASRPDNNVNEEMLLHCTTFCFHFLFCLKTGEMVCEVHVQNHKDNSKNEKLSAEF